MEFSKEEFDIMVEELLYRKPMSFKMLCKIAEKTLSNKIKYLCATDVSLCGRGYEEDIMQEVQLRLMKTTVPSFLLKNGFDGPVNADPKGFKAWIVTVAKNLKRDFSKKIRFVDFRTDNIDDPMMEKELEIEEPSYDKERTEQLREAFTLALSADAGIYKVLTWFAQFVFVIGQDVTKKQSNDMIIEAFEEKTLYEMYDTILEMSKKIDWICILPSQHERIMEELNMKWKDDIIYGNVKYKEFFMRLGKEKSGKKSISDWVNRMNSMIKKKYRVKKTKSEEDN